MDERERDALAAATNARQALLRAICAYRKADYGSLVTEPLREALRQIDHSMKEVNS